MSAVIDGATVAIKADMGASRPPFILDRDLLDDPASLLTPVTEALTDITASVINLDATWGATDWEGPLTVAEAGGATLEIWDPARLYDPGNAALTDKPTPGRVVQWTVDGVVIQTLKTHTVGHELATGITVIECIDAIAEASRQGVVHQFAQNPVDAQSEGLAADAGWADRVDQEGVFVAARASELYVGNLLEGLQRLATAELGPLFAKPNGNIGFRGRGALPNPDPVMLLGVEAGVPATNLASAVDRNAINTVYVKPIDPASATLVYRDDIAASLVGGEVSAEVESADLLLVAP